MLWMCAHVDSGLALAKLIASWYVTRFRVPGSASSRHRSISALRTVAALSAAALQRGIGCEPVASHQRVNMRLSGFTRLSNLTRNERRHGSLANAVKMGKRKGKRG